MLDQGFSTRSVRMERNYLMTVLAPAEDVERIMAAVTELAPLVMGKYDSNAFQSAAGVERYRPLEGAAAGAETAVRKRPGVVEITFEKFPTISALPSGWSRRSSRFTAIRSR